MQGHKVQKPEKGTHDANVPAPMTHRLEMRLHHGAHSTPNDSRVRQQVRGRQTRYAQHGVNHAAHTNRTSSSAPAHPRACTPHHHQAIHAIHSPPCTCHKRSTAQHVSGSGRVFHRGPPHDLHRKLGGKGGTCPVHHRLVAGDCTEAVVQRILLRAARPDNGQGMGLRGSAQATRGRRDRSTVGETKVRRRRRPGQTSRQ